MVLDVSVSIETLLLHKGVLKSMSNKSDECGFNIFSQTFFTFYFFLTIFGRELYKTEFSLDMLYLQIHIPNYYPQLGGSFNRFKMCPLDITVS